MTEERDKALLLQIKGIVSELHDVGIPEVNAYLLISVAHSGRTFLSTNITDEGQIRALLARQALDQRRMTPQVTDGLFSPD